MTLILNGIAVFLFACALLFILFDFPDCSEFKKSRITTFNKNFSVEQGYQDDTTVGNSYAEKQEGLDTNFHLNPHFQQQEWKTGDFLCSTHEGCKFYCHDFGHSAEKLFFIFSYRRYYRDCDCDCDYCCSCILGLAVYSRS